MRGSGRRVSGTWLVAVLVLASCLGGLATAVWFARSDARQVLFMSHTVLQGDVIGAGDLGVTEVALPGIATVDAARLDDIVGHRAVTTLRAGALLTPDQWGEPSLPDGDAWICLRLGPAQVPASPLPGGTPIRLFGTPAPGQTDGQVVQFDAVVVVPPVVGLDGTVVMDVAVSAADIQALTPYLLDRRVTVGRIEA